MILFQLTILFVAITAYSAAIHNPQYLRDHAETRGFRLGAPTRATPTPDDKAVLFLRSGPRSPKMDLYEFDVGSKQTRVLLTAEALLKGAEEELSAEEKARRERMRITARGFTDFQLSKEGTHILLSLSGKLYVVERDSGKVQGIKTSAGTLVDPKFSPDGKFVSYVLDYDVYVYHLKAGREIRVTDGGTANVSHGLAEFVAQEEMNRFSGYWWAPDSQRIIFQESDAREVEIWHVADPSSPEAAPHPTRYPRPGKANVKVRLAITPVSLRQVVWFDWDRERYPYLARVSWETNGPLTLTVQTRDQKELVLLEAQADSGSTKALVTERDAAWVNLRQDIPKWLPNDKGFIWASERSGDWQLEWRRPDGELQRVFPTPGVRVRELMSVDEGEVLFTGAPDATQAKLYRLPLKGGSPIELTPQHGWHGARFDKTGSVMIDSFTTLHTMPKTVLTRPDGSLIAELPSAAEKPPFTPRVEVLQTSGGRKFLAGIVRPQKFSARKRYPVIVEVYGGPLPAGSAGNVVASMPTWLLLQWLADQGFIVVAIDGRGIPGYGREWERAIRGDFATVTLADQVAGLKALARKYREIDVDRAGIFGWSFGGYMSALAVMNEGDVFKAGIAGAPVTDWMDYDTHYTERYLGIPPADAEAYERSSLLPLAKKLKRPLLLIHGTSDDNVYFRHTLKLANALFRAGRDFELLPLSSFTHMVADPVVNEQLYSRMVRFFKEHLGEPK